MSVVAPDSVPKIAWLQNFAAEQRQQTFPWCWPLVGCTVVLLLQQEAVSLHLGTKPPHAWLTCCLTSAPAVHVRPVTPYSAATTSIDADDEK